MNKSVIFLSFIFLFCNCINTPVVQTGRYAKISISKNFDSSKINRIAILPFQNIGKSGFDQSIADKFSMYFMNLGFIVIERSQIESILSEMKLSIEQSLSSEQIKQIGVKLKLDAIVFGTMQYDYVPGSSYVNKFGGQSVEGYDTLSQETIRIVSVETGEILISGQCNIIKGGSISEEFYLKFKSMNIK